MEEKKRTSLLFTFVSILGLTAASEKHSLTYIYTALSKPSGLPGIHQFTALGLLDETVIDYFSSDSREKVPEQAWMKETQNEEYWKKGTESRKSKEKWFNVNIEILMKRLRQEDNATHFLQWQHGCKGIVVDGHLLFQEGVDQYRYDGRNFLSFDDANRVWFTDNPAAETTKRKWDEVQTLKDYTRGYLESECMNWLKSFVTSRNQFLQRESKPEVFMFAKRSRKDQSKVVLKCLATGFLQKEVRLEMRRDSRLLERDDGLVSSGVRPNNRETFQREDSVEILRVDKSLFTCELLHPVTGLKVMATWDHNDPYSSPWALVGGALVVLLVLVVVAAVLISLFKKGKLCAARCGRASPVPSDPSLCKVDVGSLPITPLDNKGNYSPVATDPKGNVPDSRSDSGVSGSGSSSGSGSPPGSDGGSPPGSDGGSPPGSDRGSSESLLGDGAGGSTPRNQDQDNPVV